MPASVADLYDLKNNFYDNVCFSPVSNLIKDITGEIILYAFWWYSLNSRFCV